MKKFLSFAVSFAFASFLWFIVNLNNVYEYQLKAKIIIKNLDPEKAIKNNYPDFALLKLKGQGWKFFPFYLTSTQIWIDLSGVSKTSTFNLLNNHRVKIFIPENLQLIAVEPEAVSIELERRQTKKVPVLFSYELKKENFDFAYPPKLSPDSITISGAESIISKIDAIFTEKLTIDKVGQEITRKLKIVNPNPKLIKVNTEFVNVNFFVDQVLEREFTVTVSVLETPPDKEVLLFPPSIKVVLKAPISNFVTMETNSDTLIRAFINYRDVLNDKTGLLKPKITLPANFKLISYTPEGLEYIIRQK